MHAPREFTGLQHQAVVTEVDLVPRAVAPAVPRRAVPGIARAHCLGLVLAQLLAQPRRHDVQLRVDRFEARWQEVLDLHEQPIGRRDHGHGHPHHVADGDGGDGRVGVVEQRVAVRDGEAAVERVDADGGRHVAQVQPVVHASRLARLALELHAADLAQRQVGEGHRGRVEVVAGAYIEVAGEDPVGVHEHGVVVGAARLAGELRVRAQRRHALRALHACLPSVGRAGEGEPARGLLDERVLRVDLGEGAQHDGGDAHAAVVHRAGRALVLPVVAVGAGDGVGGEVVEHRAHGLVVRVVAAREQAEQRVGAAPVRELQALVPGDGEDRGRLRACLLAHLASIIRGVHQRVEQECVLVWVGGPLDVRLAVRVANDGVRGPLDHVVRDIVPRVARLAECEQHPARDDGIGSAAAAPAPALAPAPAGDVGLAVDEAPDVFSELLGPQRVEAARSRPLHRDRGHHAARDAHRGLVLVWLEVPELLAEGADERALE